MGLAMSYTIPGTIPQQSVADIQCLIAHSQSQCAYIYEATCSELLAAAALIETIIALCRARASYGAVSYGGAAKQAGPEGE